MTGRFEGFISVSRQSWPVYATASGLQCAGPGVVGRARPPVCVFSAQSRQCWAKLHALRKGVPFLPSCACSVCPRFQSLHPTCPRPSFILCRALPGPLPSPPCLCEHGWSMRGQGAAVGSGWEGWMILGLACHNIPCKSGPLEGRTGGQGCSLHTYSHSK